MEHLFAWLKRLQNMEAGSAKRTTVRMFSPGHQFLDFDDWLVTTEQPRRVPDGFRTGFPELMCVLAYVEDAGPMLLGHHHRMSSDLAAALSLALQRTIDIPLDIPTGLEGHNTVTFAPVSGMVDRVVSGPISTNYKRDVAQIFKWVAGLAQEDVAVIGASTSMFHGALLLHERDLRSAYALLVAGIEILSRRYGEPPGDWKDWEGHGAWDDFVAKAGLSSEQRGALHHQLMQDRQLRLKSTFRAYASCRLRDSFWEEMWTEWTYPLLMPEGLFGEADKVHEGRVSDFLPKDRRAVSQALGHSYDLRSTFVHAGRWFGPLELSINPSSLLEVTKPLPFAALRAILRELICVELEARASSTDLPTRHLRRNWHPGA